MHKLIYDGILRNYLLNMLNARIDVVNNKIEWKYKGIQHNITMNEEEKQYKVSNTQTVISKPTVQ